MSTSDVQQPLSIPALLLVHVNCVWQMHFDSAVTVLHTARDCVI